LISDGNERCVHLRPSAIHQPFDDESEGNDSEASDLNAINAGNLSFIFCSNKGVLKTPDYLVDKSIAFANFQATLFSFVPFKKRKEIKRGSVVLIQTDNVRCLSCIFQVGHFFLVICIEPPKSLASAGVRRQSTRSARGAHFAFHSSASARSAVLRNRKGDLA